MVKIKWFYDDIMFNGISREKLEDTISKKINILKKIVDHVKDVEGEAYTKLIELKTQPGYTSRYIDAMILMNAVFLRLVRERSERPEDVEKKVTILGEILLENSTVKHDHVHIHENNSNASITIDWYKDILEYLQVRDDETEEYTELVKENIDRVIKCIEYTQEIPDTDYLFILKGWETTTMQGQIFKHISVHITGGKPYLIYSEEYERYGEHMVYYFRLGRIVIGK